MRFRSHSLVTYVATGFSQRVLLFLLSIIFERGRGILRKGRKYRERKDSIVWINYRSRCNKRSSRFSISPNFLRIDPLSSFSKRRSLTINERSRDDTRNWISINGITNDTKIEITNSIQSLSSLSIRFLSDFSSKK